jgi:hypothetical protein
LFREYVAQLIEYKKSFVIVGNQNAITYKETFKLIKDNKIWLGNTAPKKFAKPDGGFQTFGNICWFTNMPNKKRNEIQIFYMKYENNEGQYPKYNGYDVINIDKTKNIPMDYFGEMGVPITFLDKYNPNQFEILGIANSARWIGFECLTVVGERNIFNRLIVRRKV